MGRRQFLAGAGAVAGGAAIAGLGGALFDAASADAPLRGGSKGLRRRPEAAPADGYAVPAGEGLVLVVRPDPFQVSLLDEEGRVVLETVAGLAGAPVAAPSLDGPEPEEPAGRLGDMPAVGFLSGFERGLEFPGSFFTGDRLLGGSGGALTALMRVVGATPQGRGWHLEVSTSDPALPPAVLEVLPAPGGGTRLDLFPPQGLPAVATTFTLESPPSEGLYGLGGRKDAFDQRGLLRTVWVEQENEGPGELAPVADPALGPTYTFPNGAQAAYYCQSLLFGSRGWAAWVGQSAIGQLDLAASHPSLVRWAVGSPRLTLWLAGGGLEAASRAFTAMAGRAPAPPSYVYLPWMDVINQQGEGDAAPDGSGFSGGAAVAARVREVVEQSAANGIPLGVVGMEGWQAVPEVASLVASLRARGLRLSAYWNPFISPQSAVYSEAAAAGYLVKAADGKPFEFVDNRGSPTALVDFTNPQASKWWASQLDRSLSLGFEAFMHDYGEQVTEGMRFSDGAPPALVHNAYPVLYHSAARKAVDAWAAAHPGSEPWFYVRSGYSAIGASPGVTASTSGVFPGDETTDWSRSSGLASVVPAMLNLALGGSHSFTTDVGGYLDLLSPRTTAELFTRWSQMAAMTAISRIHNSTIHGSVYPWSFDQETLDTYRRYALAKVRLLDLVDDWSRRAATSGAIGPVRPLVLEDPAARSVDDEWLLGRDILVAPVLTEGARWRSVYLPAGSAWERVVVGADGSFVQTGEVLAGGQTVRAPAPLSDIPIFLRRS